MGKPQDRTGSPATPDASLGETPRPHWFPCPHSPTPPLPHSPTPLLTLPK
ncbi:hypothetical protein [Tolypothrix sp. VBCCA 56010]